MQIPKIISQKAYQALVAEKTALEEKVKSLEQAASTTDLDKLKADHAEAIKTLTADNAKALEDMKAGYEKQISDLKTEVKVESVSSEAKAISTLAQIGVPSEELPKVTTKQDKTQILEDAAKLQGDELANFINKNRKAISEALKEKAKKK
jgi:hypothetical protein